MSDVHADTCEAEAAPKIAMEEAPHFHKVRAQVLAFVERWTGKNGGRARAAARGAMREAYRPGISRAAWAKAALLQIDRGPKL